MLPTPGRESYSGEETPNRSPSRSGTTSRSSRESPQRYDSSYQSYETTESDRTESIRAAREAEARQGSDGDDDDVAGMAPPGKRKEAGGGSKLKVSFASVVKK